MLYGWGTLPAWLGAVGTIGSFVVIGIGLLYEVHQRRVERRDDQAAEARLVFLDVQADIDPNHTNVLLSLRNYGTVPVRDLAIRILSVSRVPRRSRARLTFSYVQSEPDIPRIIPPNGQLVTVEVVVDTQQLPPATGLGFDVEAVFTDSKGLRWRRGQRTQPERELDQAR